MTTSNSYREAYVWIWLPGKTEPVVAGRLEKRGQSLIYNYGKNYLARADKISLFEPELPLMSGEIEPLKGLTIAGCIRDAAPDAWGRRVILNRKFGSDSKKVDSSELDELTYLLESGSDRIGAIDFQLSPTEYVPRLSQNASLEELLNSAAMIEKGIPLTPALALALQHGTAIGGARPKALIDDNGKKYIAKFSSSTDLHNVVKAEFIGMRLAHYCGISVAPVELVSVAGKDVLLIERFDRIPKKNQWQRKNLISALTLFKLDELMARYASYQDFAEIIRHSFVEASKTLQELYSRLVYNVLCGNTDDHARNHAAFWDGRMLTLTPAYDLCPQSRTGNEASQAMLMAGDDRSSRLMTCLKAAPDFMLTEEEALAIINKILQSLVGNWKRVCEEARLSPVDLKLLQQRIFLNPFIFEGLPDSAKGMSELAQKFRDA